MAIGQLVVQETIIPAKTANKWEKWYCANDYKYKLVHDQGEQLSIDFKVTTTQKQQVATR